jgi:hypothetical protein
MHRQSDVSIHASGTFSKLFPNMVLVDRLLAPYSM